MWKLFENIGLGLFVNATYSVLISLNMELPILVVLILSIAIMALAIFFQRRAI